MLPSYQSQVEAETDAAVAPNLIQSINPREASLPKWGLSDRKSQKPFPAH